MMEQTKTKDRWWEALTLLLAINSVVFGFLFGDQFGWAILVGYLPGVLLIVGLLIRSENRGVATALIVVSCIAAAGAFWTIYPVVLALIVVIGGLTTGKIGPARREAATA